MTAASTHDTKRGEDARARISVIVARCPTNGDGTSVAGPRSTTTRARASQGSAAPDRNDEWMFYQALVGRVAGGAAGSRPVPAAAAAEFVERMSAFMRKAIKEAKRHTSGCTRTPNTKTASRVSSERVLAGDRAPAFLASFVPFQRRLAWFGMLGSLAQLVLRLGVARRARTSIRAPSCGICRWSIPTIASQLISRRDAVC